MLEKARVEKTEDAPLSIEDFWNRINNFHLHFVNADGKLYLKRNSAPFNHLRSRDPELEERLTNALTRAYEDTTNGYVTNDILEENKEDLYQAYLIMREVEKDKGLFQ